MFKKSEASPRFCWADLATTDQAAARAFYSRLFGWTAQEKRVPAGNFTLFGLGNRAFASLYQLGAFHRDRGVPSHWTPYVSVADVDAAAAAAEGLGGTVVVAPQTVAGIARVGLVCDPAGAMFGLWQKVQGMDTIELRAANDELADAAEGSS